jgi:hypothetical protein
MQDEGDDAVPETAVLEKKTVEAWAQDAGFFPQFIEPPARTPLLIDQKMDQQGRAFLAVNPATQAQPPRRTNPQFWKFAAAKAHQRWPEGLTVTKAQFDEAIELVTNGITLR